MFTHALGDPAQSLSEHREPTQFRMLMKPWAVAKARALEKQWSERFGSRALLVIGDSIGDDIACRIVETMSSIPVERIVQPGATIHEILSLVSARRGVGKSPTGSWRSTSAGKVPRSLGKSVASAAENAAVILVCAGTNDLERFNPVALNNQLVSEILAPIQNALVDKSTPRVVVCPENRLARTGDCFPGQREPFDLGRMCTLLKESGQEHGFVAIDADDSGVEAEVRRLACTHHLTR